MVASRIEQGTGGTYSRLVRKSFDLASHEIALSARRTRNFKQALHRECPEV